ncbi:SufE family protein [Enterovirga rhinocerotis]|uniref:Cysteine desulfuration protein SufE n=1 Tax=Enterovirga rhinocerotis TaxID=1339210 RepID=A0A4R7BT94_9HYPH|nr:SufE family protein [Enterovirga rhinocerotis]TDR88940.1 cysteine desulfuration protein SufE [Enterovirga rhinocerotis]
MLPPISEISDNFELLDDWEDRYRYLIELGRLMPDMPEAEHRDENKVQGCASQVWLQMLPEGTGPSAPVAFRGDSDAHIVKGLVALLVALLSGRPAAEIASSEPLAFFDRFGLGQHLTPQRSNGLRAMVERIRAEAGRVAAA